MPALTTAQTPGAAVTAVQERLQTVVQDDVAPKTKRQSVSAGDRLITRQSLFDGVKRRIGTLYTVCTSDGPPAAFRRLTCTPDRHDRVSGMPVVHRDASSLALAWWLVAR